MGYFLAYSYARAWTSDSYAVANESSIVMG